MIATVAIVKVVIVAVADYYSLSQKFKVFGCSGKVELKVLYQTLGDSLV